MGFREPGRVRVGGVALGTVRRLVFPVLLAAAGVWGLRAAAGEVGPWREMGTWLGLLGLALAGLVLAWRQVSSLQLSPRTARRALAVIVAAYLVLLAGLNLLSLRSPLSMEDSGLFLQSFWNTQQGRFFVNTHEGGSHFAVHNSPILFLPYALFTLIPGLWPTIILRLLMLGASAFVLFALVRHWLEPWPALLLTTAYLLTPMTAYQAMPDLHEMNFALLPVCLALLGYVRRQPLLFAAGLLLTLACKESLVAFAVALAVIAGLERRWRWAAGTLPAALFWGWLSFGVVMPRAAAGAPPILRRLGEGDTLASALGGLLADPAELLQRLSATEALNAGLALSCFGLAAPLASLYCLLVLPQFLLLALLDTPFTVRTNWDAALFPPVLAMAAAQGLPRLSQWFARPRSPAPAVTVARGAALALALSLASTAFWYRTSPLMLPSNITAIREALRLVPEGASVTASTGLVTRLYARPTLRIAPYALPTATPPSAYLILLWDDRADAAVRATAGPREANIWGGFVRDLAAGRRPLGYEAIYARDGVYVARHETAPGNKSPAPGTKP